VGKGKKKKEGYKRRGRLEVPSIANLTKGELAGGAGKYVKKKKRPNVKRDFTKGGGGGLWRKGPFEKGEKKTGQWFTEPVDKGSVLPAWTERIVLESRS